MLDFAKQFSLKLYTPQNENKIAYGLNWLKNTTELNWAIVILGVSGHYLLYSDIFKFALDQLDDQSDTEIETLAFMYYEEHPDLSLSDSIIKQILIGIDKEAWALAFLRLFFSTLKWFCENIDISSNDYQYQLDCLCYDFDELKIIDKVVDFPYSSIMCFTHDPVIKEDLRAKYENAANRYLEVVNDPEKNEQKIKLLLRATYEAWEKHASNYPLGTPQ